MPERREFIAFTLPMLLFVALLMLMFLLKKIGGSSFSAPEYGIYPAQTILCAIVLSIFWREYRFSFPRRFLFTIATALIVFVAWVAPQALFGKSPRLAGFDPDIFAAQPLLYWVTVLLRFARLVVVVPLLEEIFWRGFLLRYLIKERFTTVDLGAFSWFSFTVVTVGFCFVHAQPDWAAALLAGALYNLVAYRTRSLASCVLAHAFTNLLLGIWIMRTGQWGFW